jgi:hypothetical protein
MVERGAAEPREVELDKEDPSGQWHVPAIRDSVSRFWHEPDAVIASIMKLIRGQLVPANFHLV